MKFRQHAHELDLFLDTCKTVLTRMISLKQKYTRANHNPVLNKTNLKFILKQTRVKTYFLK